MKKVLIAFDVDGTLIKTGHNGTGTPIPNERVRSLLVVLAHCKNVEIMVWSGGGESYARLVAADIGIRKYVDKYASKNLWMTEGLSRNSLQTSRRILLLMTSKTAS